MIKKLCSYPGCHKVVEAGVKYCDKHRETDRKKYREYKQRRMRDEQEARRQQFYNSKAWEQFRAAQAAAQLGIDIYEYYTTGRIIDAENYHHIQEIEQIGFDQWGSQTIINRLEDRWEVIPLGQGTKTMTQVINDFENLLVDERIIIAENECFRFMAKNCIAVYDEMLGVKYSKKKSKFKIDGIIAMLMGLLLCIEENGIEHYNPVEYLDAM